MQNLNDDQIKTIKSKKDIFAPMWHAQSQTFLFNKRPDNDAIFRTNLNGDFTTLLEGGYDGSLSPSGKHLAYIKRVGEQQFSDIWKQNIGDLVSGAVVP
jgi:hypothetical protein